MSQSLSGRYWIDEPLHSVVEALGSFISLSLALLILSLQKDKGVPGYYTWISCALIDMGLLDMFHAFSPPGDSFVWLHGMAILIGGFLFAMVWLPERVAQSRFAGMLPAVVTLVAIILGVFAFIFPDTLPSMVNKGVFTTVAKEMNILSGLFFLSASGYFVIRYRSDRNVEDFLFVNFCLLNGWAGLLFPLSQLWYADWWFWHLLRLIAYFIVFSYVFITFQQSEVSLRESEERYRKLVESSPDAIAIHSDGKIVFTNPAAAKLLSAANPEQLIGKEIMDFVHPDYQEPVKERIQQMKVERKDVPLIEEKFVNLDGAVIDVEVAATPFFHRGKHGIQFIVRDITERRRAEEALKEREHSYRTLSENLPGIVYRVFLRENNRMQFFNNMVQPMTGFTEEELMVGEVCSLDPLILPEDWETVITTVKRALMEKQSFHVEYRLKHKNGDVRYFSERGRPINGQDGSPLYIDGVIFDDTERKRAEEQIREQASLLDNAQEAIGVRDLKHNITYWNRGAERLYGWTVKEVIGKNPIEFLYKNKEEPPQLIEAKKIVLEKGEWEGELHQITKDGRELIVDSRWTMVLDSKGDPKSIFIINTDITDKKKLETQFLRAQRLESIGALAGGIAHDINNVLTPVVLSIQLLQKKFTDNESQKLLNILERSAKRGAGLVKQVQLFARGFQGERVAFQVSYLISEMSQIAKETFPRSIEIRTDITKDLWTISGDATQLHQIIMNLCVNARDAMPDGGILSISAENIFIDENYARVNIDARVGQYVVITVSDTGTGIPPEILDRIFEPFFTTKQPGKGTGLGLSTSLGIVKSHGGFIDVYSEVGKGTVFKVYLPVAKTAETQKADEESEPFEGHGESILVVDDEAMVREITNSILETNGYKVLNANDGQDAIKVYVQNKEKIKVVLIDMMMPDMDGQACIRALHEVNPDIRIITVSGLAEKEKLANVAVTHVKAFLQKPYTARRLLRTIHEVISGK